MDFLRRVFDPICSTQKPYCFYIILFLYIIGASSFGLHGSSLKMYASYFPGPASPLIGTPKLSRVDEWNIQSPVILHQLFRENVLSVDDGPVGPDHALLLWNAPVRHPVTFFRPQFWPFFVFAPESAFSLYWQLKICFLIGGVFSLLYFRSNAIRRRVENRAAAPNILPKANRKRRG